MPDRRDSAWSDPRTWMSLTGILLTMVLAVSGYVAKELASISSKLDSVVIANTKQETRLNAFEDRIKAFDQRMHDAEQAIAANEKAQRDYNFKLGNDLSELRGRRTK